MKSFSTFTVVLLSVFALCLSSVSVLKAGTVGNDTDAILHFEIMYDGYCDGVSLDVNSATGIATGVYGSTCATCPFTNQIGGTTGNIIGPLGITTNISYDTIGSAGPLNLFTRLNADGTWAHYGYDGSIFNSGTFSFCSPSAVVAENAVPSTAPAGPEYEN
jgi:hypothetical protein